MHATTGRAAPPLAALALLATLVAVTATACAGGQDQEKARRVGETAEPTVDPDDFVRKIDNPYMPLEPGTTLRYEGTSDEGRSVTSSASPTTPSASSA